MLVQHFVDVHESYGNMVVLEKYAEEREPDVIVCGGDLYGNRRWPSHFYKEDSDSNIEMILNSMDNLTQNSEVLFVPGNHDESPDKPELSKWIERDYKNIKNIHNKKLSLDGFDFGGYGYSDPEAFIDFLTATYGEKRVEDFADYVRNGGRERLQIPGLFYPGEAQRQLRKLLKKMNPVNSVLVSHTPPKGGGDDKMDYNNLKMHSGSPLLRDILEESDYSGTVLCGDVHEAVGVDRKQYTVVNPGPLSGLNPKMAFIKIKKDKKPEVELIEYKWK